MATFTTNYNLRKPADSDFIENDTDLNANWDIIDSELKDAQDRAYNSPYCIVEHDVDTTLPDTTDTKISVALTARSSASDFTVASDQITVVDSGVYHISAMINWNSNANNNRLLKIVAGGSVVSVDLASDMVGTASGGSHGQSTSCLAVLDAGDTIYIEGWQNSGGSLANDDAFIHVFKVHE